MLKNGTIINNRYKVIDSIGKGGSSFVYLIRDINIGKRWALKEIPKKDRMSIYLAKGELNLLKSIDYGMFPRIADAFVERDCLYLVNDYVEGISLDKVIREKSISKDKAFEWACKILEALAYLHGLSPPILYLDLKPDNILVMPNGNIKMVDFGIARRITSDYQPLGTPGFAAPEQYNLSADNISERTDIFAFGMTYYAIREGVNPNEDIDITRKAIQDSKILSRSEKSFIIKCIQTKPEDRFDCVQNVSHHIKHISLSKINPGKIINYIGITIMLIFILAMGIMVYGKERARNQSAMQMIYEASNYISDGDYTLEGLKIITAFLDSGCLDDKTQELFTLDVAMNYFLIQHDYNQAYRYFSKLDEDRYAEAPLLMELCRAQTGFNYDSEKILYCVGRLYDIAIKRADDYRKHELFFIIAQCYEDYDPENLEGYKKAITVLEEGKRQLNNMSNIKDKSEWDDILKKYESRLEVLYEKSKKKIQNGKEQS